MARLCCIFSIIFTLNLLRTFTAQKRSLNKIQFSSSSSSKSPPKTTEFLTLSTISTPKPTKSKNEKMKKTELLPCLTMLVKWALIVMSVLILKFVFLFVFSDMMEIKVSNEMVATLSEKSRFGFVDKKDRFGVLRNALKQVVGDDDHGLVSNPTCHIIQDGLILRYNCQLYKSGIEEVSVWGWPYQTTGLVKTKFDSRSFTVLSGKVTELSNGVVSCSIRQANTSWEQGKWSTYGWRMDKDTWILEYNRSFVFDNTQPFTSAMEFLQYKMMKAFQWMKKLWLCVSSHIRKI